MRRRYHIKQQNDGDCYCFILDYTLIYSVLEFYIRRTNRIYRLNLNIS
jgi:hypothetical protein